MISAFRFGSRSFCRTYDGLAMLLVLAVLGACSLACAQTAQFSYAIRTLGDGFRDPMGVAVDGSGNVYVADASGEVEEIPDGCASASCVKTLGGGFSTPFGVSVDGSGNVYVADTGNNAVKEIPAGCASASCVTALGGEFSGPSGVSVDGSGNVYVADTYNNAVKEIPAGCASASCVAVLGGEFSEPNGTAVDKSGNVYVVDFEGNAVNVIPASCISGANNASCVGTLGGGFSQPFGVAVDGSGNVFVTDSNNNSAVKEIPPGCTTAGCVITLGGGFSEPHGMAVDGSGNVYVVDTGHTAVKELELRSEDFRSEPVSTASAAQALTFSFNASVTLGAPAALTMGAPNLDFAIASGGTCTSGASFTSGDTCTVNATFTPKYAGPRNGALELTDSTGAVIATAYVHGIGQGPQVVFNPGAITTLGGGFSGPVAVAVDGSGNVYVGDFSLDNNASVVKEISTGCTSAGCVQTLGGGFSNPSGVAVDGGGNVYVSDAAGTVKEIPTGCASAVCVETLGGGFSNPSGVAVDGGGNVYVTDPSNGNPAVKEIPASCIAGANNASCVVTLGGGGFSAPEGMAVDGSGNVYVADLGDGYGGAVKEIPASCIAGANNASCVVTLGGGFIAPADVAVDGSGNVYVVDNEARAVKEIPPGCTSAGCVLTLGGEFNVPFGLAVDGSGNIYVAGDAVVKEFDRVTPPSLSFASTNIGSTSSDSPQTVTVENIGNQPLTFPIPTIAGSYNPSVPANFSYSDSSTCLQNGASAATAFTLASGASCTVVIDFTPLAAGSLSGDAVLTNDSQNASAPNYAAQQISLSGTGVLPITQLGFSTVPAATITAGGNAGTITVAEQDATGATVTTGADSITLTVTGPNSYSKTYTATASSGIATFDLSSAALTTAGSYTYTATSGSYTEATAAESVSAASAASTFSLTVSGGQEQTVAAGSTATYTLQISPTNGAYPGNVSFSVSGLPSGATASFSPSTIAANGGAQTVTMTIQTSGTTKAENHHGSLFQRGAPFALGFLLLPFFAVRKRKGWMRMLAVALLLVGAGAFTGLASGCGGSSSQQQESRTLTVTATAGTMSESTTVTLNLK